MKENLIIALGDSYTYGHGAYDAESLAKFNQHKLHYQLHRDARQHMAENSWPAQLGRMIDYDVINMGQGGSANSAHAKWLINSKRGDILNAGTQYKNVIVIWLLTEPWRYSLYSSHQLALDNILNIHTRALIDGVIDYGADIKQFAELYFQLANVESCKTDTVFYIKAVENYCAVNGYKFLFGNAFSYEKYYYNSPSDLHANRPYQSMRDFLAHDDKNCMSKVCKHPNAMGYQLIAKELREILLERAWI